MFNSEEVTALRELSEYMTEAEKASYFGRCVWFVNKAAPSAPELSAQQVRARIKEPGVLAGVRVMEAKPTPTPWAFDEIERLKAIISKAGFCSVCGEEFVHDMTEPFASCKCGSTEWTSQPPELSMLRYELMKLRGQPGLQLRHDAQRVIEISGRVNPTLLSKDDMNTVLRLAHFVQGSTQLPKGVSSWQPSQEFWDWLPEEYNALNWSHNQPAPGWYVSNLRGLESKLLLSVVMRFHLSDLAKDKQFERPA